MESDERKRKRSPDSLEGYPPEDQSEFEEQNRRAEVNPQHENSVTAKHAGMGTPTLNETLSTQGDGLATTHTLAEAVASDLEHVQPPLNQPVWSNQQASQQAHSSSITTLNQGDIGMEVDSAVSVQS